MSELGPTSELARRLSTKREDLHRQQVNVVFNDLETRIQLYRAASRLARHAKRRSNFQTDVLSSALHGMFGRATDRLAALGEH